MPDMLQEAKFHPVTHVIFDMDGLLLDTENHYTIAHQQVLQRFGHDFTWEMKHKMMGRKPEEAVRVLIDHFSLPISGDRFMSECTDILHGLFPQANCMPGAEKLVRHLHANNVPICICTGSSRVNYEIKTTRHKDLFGLFNHVVCSPDEPEVKRGKPEPDCFLLAAKRFREAPQSYRNVLVFEDSFNGVQAALKADMQVVMVPDNRMDEHSKKQATLCLNSLDEFLPEWFSLPPY